MPSWAKLEDSSRGFLITALEAEIWAYVWATKATNLGPKNERKLLVFDSYLGF